MRGGSVFLTVIFSLMIESANPQSTGGVLNPLHEDAAAARAGKSIYEKRCQECHGGDARGGRGPALVTGSFQVRADDRYLFDTIKNGTPGTAMPPFETRSDTNIWQVVTYLRSLAGTVREEVVSGDVIAGEEVFRGKGGCLSCHQVHGEGGRIGPDLSRIGKWGGIKALNPESGKTEWEYKYHLGTWSAGVLATAGGVVFSGSREGNLMTFDSRSGKLLGSFQTGGQIDSSPISYAVDGRQYVALAAGTVIYSFALPDDPEN